MHINELIGNANIENREVDYKLKFVAGSDALMDNNYFNTIHSSVTIGTNPGYDLENQKRMDIGEFTALFQRLAEEEQKQSGVWITAVITPSRLAYMTSVGCPLGGEYSYTLTGSCNTVFTTVDSYLPALKRVLKRMKEELQQATFTLEVLPAHLDYYTDNN